MILQVNNKDEFINSFLSPLSRINNTCVLNVTDKGIHTLLAAADNTVILYGQYKKSLEVSDPLTLNLPVGNRKEPYAFGVLVGPYDIMALQRVQIKR